MWRALLLVLVRKVDDVGLGEGEVGSGQEGRLRVGFRYAICTAALANGSSSS